MYRVTKRLEISASHRLALNYPSKCGNLHGHNWIITVTCQAEELNENGMVEDFTEIKARITSQLDHANLNEVLPFNPTAENIARWICDQIPSCIRVDVQESEGNTASYFRGEWAVGSGQCQMGSGQCQVGNGQGCNR